jgi:hypothetical protein
VSVPRVAALHRALITRAVKPASTPGHRERSIIELLDLAGARRVSRWTPSSRVQRRLARRSDDFDATDALCMVEGAPVRATRPDSPWRWPAADRRVRRRRA